MPVDKIKKYLDDEQIKYVSIYHSPSYTAQEIAESAHVSGDMLAKTVIVKHGKGLKMVVLPASMHIDFDRLKEVLNPGEVALASEEQFKDRFQKCEIGAMPPFGNLYDMEVYVDETLTHGEKIAFNAGSHVELIELAYEDFNRLVKPRIIKVSSPIPIAA